MAKIYIVTSGSYSDYSIDRVFSAKPLAEEWLKNVGGAGDYEIEEHEIDDMSNPPFLEMAVELDPATGNVLYVSDRPSVRNYWDREDTLGQFVDQRWRSPPRRAFTTQVRTTDKMTAIKVAGERMAALKSHQAGDEK